MPGGNRGCSPTVMRVVRPSSKLAFEIPLAGLVNRHRCIKSVILDIWKNISEAFEYTLEGSIVLAEIRAQDRGDNRTSYVVSWNHDAAERERESDNVTDITCITLISYHTIFWLCTSPHDAIPVKTRWRDRAAFVLARFGNRSSRKFKFVV